MTHAEGGRLRLGEALASMMRRAVAISSPDERLNRRQHLREALAVTGNSLITAISCRHLLGRAEFGGSSQQVEDVLVAAGTVDRAKLLSCQHTILVVVVLSLQDLEHFFDFSSHQRELLDQICHLILNALRFG